MPTTLGKNLHLCFTGIKRPAFPMSAPRDHSRTLPTPAAALIKNFNSIYDLGAAASSKSHRDENDDEDRSSDSDSGTTTTPDFASVYASQRFFFSSPGRSNSIIDSSTSSSSHSSDTPAETEPLITGGVAIPTYSPDPYMDFRRSMQEMVEAHDLIDVRANWEYLHQLLLCYLSLNPKPTHKYILGAFADLLVTLMSPPQGCAVGDPQADPSNGNCGGEEIPRRFM